MTLAGRNIILHANGREKMMKKKKKKKLAAYKCGFCEMGNRVLEGSFRRREREESSGDV